MTEALEDFRAEDWLKGTPYLIGGDDASAQRFFGVYGRSITTRERAVEVASRVATDAREILDPFAKALRTDLVAESNRLEGYEWTRPAVRNLVELHQELVTGPLHAFMTALREDKHLMEALGLYRAYLIADDWVKSATRPREYEIRGLHAVILAGTDGAGSYKSRLNEIAGSEHVPVDPFEVGRAMADLTTWWLSGSPDPVLDATVVHAWVTHIHAFEDGNGRLARLLANMALTQSAYPPLIIRSQSDRGQYLDALAASDEGDILPLYDLFTQVLKRSVKEMSRESYARDFLRDRLLGSQQQRYDSWMQLTYHFTECLRRSIRARGWDATFQGYPDNTSFALLSARNREGSGWYLKIIDDRHEPRWLLRWGYNSHEVCDLLDRAPAVPSILVAVRDDNPTAVHPFRIILGEDSGLPEEVVLLPGEPKPVLIRTEYRSTETSVETATELLAAALCA